MIDLQVVDEELPREGPESVGAPSKLAAETEIPVLVLVTPGERVNVEGIGQRRLETSPGSGVEVTLASREIPVSQAERDTVDRKVSLHRWSGCGDDIVEPGDQG